MNRLGNLATAIYNQAQRALPHGTCPGVGVGGHATHGGYGYAGRAWGLALDTIVALDVVLANGTLIHATSTAYPDVYWAMRGAGESFGVVTTFYMQTQPAPASVVNFSYDFNGLFSSVASISAFFTHVQTFAQNASVVDANLGGLGMYMDGNGLSLSGVYLGSVAAYQATVEKELLRTLPAPASSSVKTLGWIDSLVALSGASTLATPVHGYSAHDNFFAKSVTVPQASPLTAAALSSYFGYMIQQGPSAPTSWWSILNLYGGPGSAINSKDTTFSAYADRSALWVAQHYAYLPQGQTFPASGITWLNGLSNAMTSQMPGADFGAYLNYVDPTLTADQAHQLYYGTTVYNRLKSIKTVVDPNNVFSNPQSI
jgi:hypothetical protein